MRTNPSVNGFMTTSHLSTPSELNADSFVSENVDIRRDLLEQLLYSWMSDYFDHLLADHYIFALWFLLLSFFFFFLA